MAFHDDGEPKARHLPDDRRVEHTAGQTEPDQANGNLGVVCGHPRYSG
jgi:hypothetical protein